MTRGACCTIQPWLYPLQPANNDSSVRENSKNRAGAPSQTKRPDLWSVPRSLLPLIPCLSVLRSFLWHSTDVIQKHPREQLHCETVLSSSLSLSPARFFFLLLSLSISLSRFLLLFFLQWHARLSQGGSCGERRQLGPFSSLKWAITSNLLCHLPPYPV